MDIHFFENAAYQKKLPVTKKRNYRRMILKGLHMLDNYPLARISKKEDVLTNSVFTLLKNDEWSLRHPFLVFGSNLKLVYGYI